MKDHRILPKVVLLEGINRVGKTTVINQFKEIYGKQIQVIKFPYSRKIVAKIVFLYREISKMSDPHKILNYLEIIHQLFDLDFRQFCTLRDIHDVSKVYFLDRYYPSNYVYAYMHGVSINPVWIESHYLKPDVVLLLRITEQENKNRLIREFPVYDNAVWVETEEGIANEVQLLTPQQMIKQGQEQYQELMYRLESEKKIEKWFGVEALEETTFRECERILIRHGIL